MARQIVSAILLGDYTADRGTDIENVSYRFGVPTDFTDAEVNTLLAAAGARRKTAADRTGCPVASDFKPRKLEFTRRDGNSLSVVLADKDNAVTVATAVRTAINASGNPVQCVQLIGEKWSDLLLELRTATGAPVAGTPSRSSQGGKQYAHSGKVLYGFDAGGGNTRMMNAKIDTDVVSVAGVTSPPTILDTAWVDCVGDFEENNPCSSKKAKITPRHYLATLLTTSGYQTSEIPVTNGDPADILACGGALADLESIVCLKYKGEKNKRFHLLLP
jgi:hypothetical protein